ncbi:uncharacterized protein LOC136091614 [Hydra vulgaris]|uniref:Uncharacterized protein LOC136091614 n=1 Tax=Hydra vulgaris TaxID=6087 RepID=A0ABM4DLI6_HYDVU
MTTTPKSNILMRNVSYEILLLFLQTQSQNDATCIIFSTDAVDPLKGSLMKIIDIIAGVLICILNVLLVNGVRRCRRKGRSYTHNEKLVLLLSSVDLMIALVYLPLEIVTLLIIYPISCILINIEGFWLLFTLGLSGSIVSLISIERFIAIFNDKKCCGFKFNGVYAAIILCFHLLICSGLGIWRALFIHLNLQSQEPYFFFMVATYTISNIISVLVMNTLLLIKAKKKLRAKEIRVAQHDVVERRLTQTMILISISYTVSYFPAAATAFYYGVILYLNEFELYRSAGNILFWAIFCCKINALSNAFIYIIRSKNILNFYKDCIASILKKDAKHISQMQLPLRNVSTHAIPIAISVSENYKNVFCLK